MRLLLLCLIALVGCASSQIRPEPASDALRRVWLLYVPTVKSPVEAQFATTELRRMLSESGRFLLVDEPSVAHVIVQASFAVQQSSVTDRVGSYDARSAPPAPETATISLFDARDPETPIWSRSTKRANYRFSQGDANRALDPDRQTLFHLARAISASLIEAAGPRDQVRSTP